MNQLGQQNILSLIKSLMQETAISLGKSLDQLDYPNTNRGDAPFNEANILVHLAATLRAKYQDALFYAEVPITPKGRIDLLASFENVNLIVEAKGLGGVRRCAELQDQLMRFEQFSPACSDREDEKECGKWWKSAEATYGLAVIGSHKEISEAWRSGGSSKVPKLFSKENPRLCRGTHQGLTYTAVVPFPACGCSCS